MVSFLTPIFLWAGAAATIPLLLHLMQSRRTTRVPFGTIRFLKLAQRRSSRRIRMEHLILWLLRTLLMLLLAAAFAMPILRTGGLAAFLGRANRDVAIVIDTSFSMNYVTGRTTVWDNAVDAAVSVIEGLSEQDRVCVFLADTDTTPLIEQLSGDHEATIARIKDRRPTYTSSVLEPAVAAASAALAEEERRRDREIHIITDNQAVPWGSFDEWEPGDLPERTKIFVSMLGVPNPENTAPLDVKIDPPVIMADMPVSVTVQLMDSDERSDTTLALYLDGAEIDRRAVSQEKDSKNTVDFTIPPLGEGIHSAYVETPKDSLPIDDSFHFLIRTSEYMPTLCVGSQDATRFLRLALTAGGEQSSGIAIKSIAADALQSESLSSYACLFLCDSISLPGQDVMRVEQYVRGGGLLVVIPGDTTAIDDYALWRCLPGLPSEISLVPSSERTHLLRWRKQPHPLLHRLRQGVGVPVVAIQRRLTWTELHEDTEVLATAGADDPFLLSRPYGRGYVLFLSVSANRTWSDFPLSPYYLPLTHQIVQYAAGIGVGKSYLWSTDSLSLREDLPEATGESSLQDPEGNSVPIHSVIVNGETALRVENLALPGIYTLATQSRPVPTPALAVNVPRTESDLTPIDPVGVRTVLGVDVAIAQDNSELLRLIEEHRVGKTFGETLLWLALFVALIEVVFANALARDLPRLSETLHIDAGGKVAAA